MAGGITIHDGTIGRGEARSPRWIIVSLGHTAISRLRLEFASRDTPAFGVWSTIRTGYRLIAHNSSTALTVITVRGPKAVETY